MSKFVVVTGGNTGMGLETCKELCRLGYHVTFSARSHDKGAEAVESIKSKIPHALVQYMIMELKDLASVRNFAKEYLDSKMPLHILINNAGIMNTPFEVTADGFEAQFQVNHLSHFLLTHYLLPRIRESEDGGRVVNLSSRAHMRWSGPIDLSEVFHPNPASYDGWGAYGRSKLCNILFARHLTFKFPLSQHHINFFSLHPGLVDTKLLNVAPGLNSQAIPITEGIRCCMYLATSNEVCDISGEYYHNDCTLGTANNVISSIAKSMEEAEKLWKASLDMVGLTDAEYGV